MTYNLGQDHNLGQSIIKVKVMQESRSNLEVNFYTI